MKRFLNFLKGLGIIGGVIAIGFLVTGHDFVSETRSTEFGGRHYASPYIYVMNRETKEVVYEQKEASKAFPASLTKLMTVLVALEEIEDLSSPATVDYTTYHEMIIENSSMAGFAPNEVVTYEDLLYGSILSSGGEAANSLAINISGNLEDFVDVMNVKATELNMDDTHFTNPEGLHDEDQYTTASDIAKLLDYALENDTFKELFTSPTYLTLPTPKHPEGINLRSTIFEHLDSSNQKGFEILGGKSGTTYKAGQNWATLGLVEGNEYLTIVMGAPLKDLSHPDRAQIKDTLAIYREIKRQLK